MIHLATPTRTQPTHFSDFIFHLHGAHARPAAQLTPSFGSIHFNSLSHSLCLHGSGVEYTIRRVINIPA